MNHRQFTLSDQHDFAVLSGDFNPLHIDPTVARRLMFGGPVVHGVHALLWGLDTWLAEQDIPLEFLFLKVRFLKPILVQGDAACEITRRDESSVTIQLTTEGKKAVTIKAEFSPTATLETSVPDERPARTEPRDLCAAEVSTATGQIPLLLDRKLASDLFPHVLRFITLRQLAAVLATSRLVGMDCPGLHSTYSELSLKRHSTASVAAVLRYQVTQWDDRFHLLSIDITAPGLSGAIQAFVRPAPTRQAGLADLRKFVDFAEFSRQTALVVGGSRGLGEVTAKLLAAGGADVRLTYHRGKDDARSIVDDIRDNGGTAESFSLDVLDPFDQLRKHCRDDWIPTHLYYFATPFVFVGAEGIFSEKWFNLFCSYYVTGFEKVVSALDTTGLKTVFYPSSVAIDELPLDMSEYVAAKQAGEALCELMRKRRRSLTVRVARLPRLATDQTASVYPVENQDPVHVLLNELRQMATQQIASSRSSN